MGTDFSWLRAGPVWRGEGREATIISRGRFQTRQRFHNHGRRPQLGYRARLHPIDRIEVVNGAVRERFNIIEIQPAQSGVTLAWESTADEPVTYAVQRAASPAGSWTVLAESLASQGAATSYTDAAAPAGPAFYRIVKFPPPVIFETGVEPGEDLTGWTEVIEFGQSQWEIGAPSSGPGSANTAHDAHPAG